MLAVDVVSPAESPASFLLAGAEVYPSVPYRPTAGDFDTLLSIQKARKLLGYEPRWSWRDHIADT